MSVQPINIDPNKLDTQICPECEGIACCEVFMLKHLPALISPSGKPQILKVPQGFICTACGANMFNVIPPTEKPASKPDIKLVSK